MVRDYLANAFRESVQGRFGPEDSKEQQLR